MLKKDITYTDFNGVERTETFRFHLSKGELMDMELGTDEGLSDFIHRITNAKDTAEIAKTFKKILLRSYGEMSDDGRYFNKSKKIRKRFKASPVFTKVYMSFFDTDNPAITVAEFIEGIMPKELVDEAKKQGLLTNDNLPATNRLK